MLCSTSIPPYRLCRIYINKNLIPAVHKIATCDLAMHSFVLSPGPQVPPLVGCASRKFYKLSSTKNPTSHLPDIFLPILNIDRMSSRVWLITGANSGLGLALAQVVLSKGDKVEYLSHVICLRRDQHTAAQVIAAARDAAKIPASLSGAKAYTLDPSAPEAEVKRATKAALEIYGRIDVLVNNAGYGQHGFVEELRCVFPP